MNGNSLPLGHEYMGNVCSGFGGNVGCKYPSREGPRGTKCGKSPEDHEPQSVLHAERHGRRK